MKTAFAAAAIALACAATGPQAAPADEPTLQRLLLCQDSWLDWKDDDSRMGPLVRYFETSFNRAPRGGAFTPKAPMQVLGHSVVQVYPQNVGMGVGFSLVVDVGFAQARAGMEQQLGRPMSCTTSDGMRACELRLDDKKTAMLVTGLNGNAPTSLVGCYYFYAQ